MALLQSEQTLKVGNKAPGFSDLPATDGKSYSLSDFKALSDFKGRKAVLVIFMCNHCPYVIAKFDAIKELAAWCKGRDVAVVGINVNDAVRYPEDSFDSMKELMDEKQLGIIYCFDESQKSAKEYGAVCTPDPFLIDADGRIAWHGRINDQMEPGDTPKSEDMKEAIDELLKTGKVTKEFLPSQGCSIKWK